MRELLSYINEQDLSMRVAFYGSAYSATLMFGIEVGKYIGGFTL